MFFPFYVITQSVIQVFFLYSLQNTFKEHEGEKYKFMWGKNKTW